jgi:hypothetical protein
VWVGFGLPLERMGSSLANKLGIRIPLDVPGTFGIVDLP